MQPRPSTLIAELSYQCPLHCPYCSNPLDIGGEHYRRELETEQWIRAFGEARRLGVLQLALTGGEPMLRRDLVELCAAARDAGLYSSLITAGTLFTRDRAQALKAARLDHVQISIHSPDAETNDRIAGNRSFEKKIAAARHAKELDLPLTINCVLHRQNLDRIEDMLDLALDLGAQRLELANTQYYGWAVANQAALMPSREQLRRAEDAVQRFRERVGPKVDVLWVLPDYYEEYPKPCMGGWGRDAMVVTPNGDVLPCQAAATIPGLEFANVRDKPLAEIWFESAAFNMFRGTDWMPEPCASCPIDLDVQPGEFFGFLGPNGAGKTTTIRMLTTLLQPTRGAASVAGRDVQREPLGVRREIGVVFQETTLDLDLTAEENLRFCTRLYGLSRKESAARIDEALRLFELSERRRERVRSFSGGMRRALDLARGILHRPSVLFLDEPTLGLDVTQRRRIWEFLLRLSNEYGTTLFLTTHYLEEADPCDRVAIVDRGQIVA